MQKHSPRILREHIGISRCGYANDHHDKSARRKTRCHPRGWEPAAGSVWLTLRFVVTSTNPWLAPKHLGGTHVHVMHPTLDELSKKPRLNLPRKAKWVERTFKTKHQVSELSVNQKKNHTHFSFKSRKEGSTKWVCSP